MENLQTLIESNTRIDEILEQILSEMDERRRYVLFVKLTPEKTVAAVKFKYEGESIVRSKEEVISDIEDGITYYSCKFAIDRRTGEPSILMAEIMVIEPTAGGSEKHLRTVADQTKKDNLLRLPTFD